VPVGNQHHGRVAVAIPVALGGLGELGHFRIRQILARAQFGVGPTTRRDDCSVFGAWRDQFQMRLQHGNQASSLMNCSNNNPFTNSGEGLVGESK
jgi:hypothetical protein